MPEIKAIETVYKGYRFRSRLEARWAVYFDACNIKWEYEKEGYVLPDGTGYLPDFWLPDYFAFIEIKGQPPTEKEISKAKQLRDITGHPVFILPGEVGVPVGLKIAGPNQENNEFYMCFLIWLCVYHPEALLKARGARFEFGESG